MPFDDDMRHITRPEKAADRKAVRKADKGRVKDNPATLAKARAVGGKTRKAGRSKKGR